MSMETLVCNFFSYGVLIVIKVLLTLKNKFRSPLLQFLEEFEKDWKQKEENNEEWKSVK